MKGQIIEWNNDKGYRRGLLVAGETPESLVKQGRALVYILDENLNIQRDNEGKQLKGVVTLKNTILIGFQD
jgi:hypothetical protein